MFVINKLCLSALVPAMSQESLIHIGNNYAIVSEKFHNYVYIDILYKCHNNTHEQKPFINNQNK